MASSSSTSVGGGGGSGGGEEVCCMCGDHGLPEELFRCRLCRVRLQHRYCSDLYPRATAYRRCNWCLREPTALAGGGHAHEAADKPTVRRKATPSSPSSSTEETASNSDGERKLLQEAGCSASRREAGAGLGRPVKKQKAAADERKAHVVTTGAAATKGNGNKKLMQAGKKTGVKQVRVRRYKLLAEVISC
ncbi:hypothetical protein ABZP36_007206 [Zizania latifolia]